MTRAELMEANNAILSKMQNATEEEYKGLEREFNNNKSQIMQLDLVATAPKAQREGQSVVKMVREAMGSNKKQFTMYAGDMQSRSAISTTGAAAAIDTDIQGILEPLYANSVLSKLGVKWYTGLPMGNVQIPVMGAGTVGWAGELAAAGESTNTFSSVLLQPKRLTAYVDISKMLIAQDNHGVEAAIRRDIVNAINDKLEATVFGAAAGSTTQPAGMFYDTATSAARTLEDGTTFANICKIEAEVENNNVYGNMKYLLSTGAKADLRAMAKSTKNTQLVYEGGTVDGVPAETTSNVTTAGAYIYGDFSNLAIGSWGNVDITVDEYTQAVNGCVRLIVNAYFDEKILREVAFAYGKTRA